LSGQAGAIRHGIARALVDADEEQYKVTLKKAGFLTRDSRVKERKKYGLKKGQKGISVLEALIRFFTKMESAVVKKTVTTTSPVETRALGYALASISSRRRCGSFIGYNWVPEKHVSSPAFAEGMRVKARFQSHFYAVAHP